MMARLPQLTQHDFISSLFGPSPLAFGPVAARLLAQALGRLHPESERLTFELAFEDILPGGNADGQRYAELVEAQTRLTQPLQYEALRKGDRCSEHMVLVTSLRLDEDTERISGEFNPHLQAYWRELVGAFTAAELEALFLLRWVYRPRPV